MSTADSKDVKSKESANVVDVNFEWGKMPQQDISGQFTRSMMEMRKPKAFELPEPPRLLNSVKKEDISTAREVEIPECPIVAHTIKLIKYMKKVQYLLSKLDSRSIHGYNIQCRELSTPPPFENAQPAVTRRSRSSSSGESDDVKEKFLFSAPKTHSDFRLGTKIAQFPPMDPTTTSRILKRSVATVASHTGFVESTSSSLNVLTGLAEAFMISFSRSLRHAADVEAQTGRTAYFDCLDQALHECGYSGLSDVEKFWQNKVVRRHKVMQTQADKLANTLKSRKFQNPEEVKKQMKPESLSSFPSSYGKWTPVTGMSSSPFTSGRTTDTSSGTGWGEKSDVKRETTEQSSTYSFVTASQQSASTRNIKNEYSGFEFFTKSPSIDLLNTDRNVSSQSDEQFSLEDQQGLYGMDDYRPSRKKTRNM